MPENAKGNNKNNGDGVVIKLGDIVYRADGLRGNVIAKAANNGYIASYEGGKMEHFSANDLSNFWLIGKQIIGNKAPTAPIEQEVKDLQNQIAALRKQEQQLRKQIYRIKNQFYESWEADRLALQEERTEQNRAARLRQSSEGGTDEGDEQR